MTPDSEDQLRGSPDACPMATSRLSWAEAYGCNEPHEALARYSDALHEQGWIAIARTFESRLNVEPFVPASLRPGIGPASLAPTAVFLLAATNEDPPGRLGHVSAELAVSGFGSTTVEMPGRSLEGGHLVADQVARSLMRVVRFLAPDASVPGFEIVIPRDGVGDSHALACGVTGMLALLGAASRPGVAATGGFDVAQKRFTPVPAATIHSKLEAARRWGIQRLLVVEGQSFAGVPGFAGQAVGEHSSDGVEWSGIEIMEVPSDPASLPVLVADLVAMDPPHAALRQALGLYDFNIARMLETTLDSVFEATAPFIPREIDAEVCRRTGGARSGGRTSAEGSSDPILVLMAADIRSRKCLHEGRSEEAAIWLEIARKHRHRGDLPDGVIGDYLQYEQAAHRAIVAVDQGVLEDPQDGPRVHAELDELIVDLDQRWRTRHQSMQRVFLRNTRARRLLYLARLTGRQDLRQQAIEDCLSVRPRWTELLEDHGARELKLGNTNLRRQENFWLEHLVTEASMIDPAAFSAGRWHPGAASIAGLKEAVGIWTDSRDIDPDRLSGYDLLGLVQWRWLTESVEAAEFEAMRCRLLWLVDALPRGSSPGHPLCSVAEWLLRFASLNSSDRRSLHHVLIKGLAPHVAGATPEEGAVDGQAGSIQRVLALRSAAVLDQEGVPVGDGPSERSSWLAAIRPLASPESLQGLFDDIRSDPRLIAARCPY